MNSRLLEVLRAVLATGSATAAAKLLGLSQSGVSRLLQQLEDDLQLALFIREKGRLIATPEAMKLSHNVDHVLSGLDRFSNLARDLRTGAIGPDVIRFGLPNSMSEVFAPGLLVAFKKEFPGIRFETFFDTSTANTLRVEQRILDFAFMRDEDKATAQVEMEHVLTGTSVCVMSRDHPLAAKASIGPRDLRGQPLIMIGSRRPARRVLDQIFSRAGVTQLVEIETHSNGSACAFAANGLGIAIVSSFFANLYLDLPLVQRPFLPKMTQGYGIATAAGVPLSIATTALIRLLKEQVKQRDANS